MKKVYNLKNIKEAVDMVTGLDIATLTRQREYVYARSLYYKIALEYTGTTYHKIINEVGVKQHGTLLSSVDQFESILKYRNYKQLYDSCLEVLGIEVEKEESEELSEKYTETQISVFNELKKLTDTQLLDFKETRLKPYLKTLESRVEQKVILKVNGARLRQ